MGYGLMVMGWRRGNALLQVAVFRLLGSGEGDGG